MRKRIICWLFGHKPPICLWRDGVGGICVAECERCGALCGVNPMSGSYPPGCSQSDHDRAFGELASPEELFDETDADEQRYEEEEEECSKS